MTLVRHSDRTIRKACYCHNRTDLYWAHDTDITTFPTTTSTPRAGASIDPCDKCGVTGLHVLTELDGSRHLTKTEDDASTTTPVPAPTPASMPNAIKPMPTPATPPVTAAATVSAQTGVANSQTEAIAQLIGLLSPPAVSPEEIERIVKQEIQNVAFPTNTVVITATETRTVEGHTHTRLADVLLDLSISEHVLMVGPAGTGKSTIARQAAKALDIPYGEISLNPGLTATALLGYMNATGEYVKTVFREIWENGGVFHADEFDNGHPSTLATLNAALATSAGGSIAFPDGMITRHDDFRFVASANTFGRGPDRVYVGRQQLDAATLDRFVVEEIDIDESLEHAVCLATGYDSPKVSEVLRYIRQLRNNAAKQKSLLLFSPRASIGMCKLLQAGKPLSKVIESRVRKGISDSDWSKVSDGVSNPSV